jgi:N-acetylmuramoyl-L-alanine amidase
VNTRRNRVIVVALAAVAALVVASIITLSGDERYDVEGRMVVLDPGHFENAGDTGALNHIDGIWLEERDVNWEVTLATRLLLTERGILVTLTRQEGEFIARPERYRIANASGGEVLISIHHNGVDDHRINYTTTFYTHQADISIARRVQDQLVAMLEFPDGDIRRDTFGMTLHPSMPAALTEAWFITHDDTAARYLAENAARTSTVPGLGWREGSLVELEARALADAIIEYLGSVRPPAGDQ